MQIKKNVIYSAIFSLICLIISVLATTTPCRVRPGLAVPNPVYKWTLCSLNPDQASSLNFIKEYFGYTSSITDAFLITILISFAVSFFFLYFFSRKKNK
jgi:hypothetical protein